MKATHVTARGKRWYDNVACILLSVEETNDQGDPEKEMVYALQQKYDALKDKILMEVCATESYSGSYVFGSCLLTPMQYF